MAEWYEIALLTQAQIPNYFAGREGERGKGEIVFGMCIVLSIMICKV